MPVPKFVFILLVVLELSGGEGRLTQPPLGKGVGQKHLGSARVNDV